MGRDKVLAYRSKGGYLHATNKEAALSDLLYALAETGYIERNQFSGVRLIIEDAWKNPITHALVLEALGPCPISSDPTA